MRTTFVLAVAVGLATWAAAQQQNNPPAAQNSSASDQVTVRGCLTGAAHQYRLVDDNHVVYALVGQDKELSGFDGQQVEVKGKLEEQIPPKEKQTASSFSRPQHRLTAAAINKLSDTCTGASE